MYDLKVSFEAANQTAACFLPQQKWHFTIFSHDSLEWKCSIRFCFTAMHVWTKCPTDCSSETQQIKNVSGLHCCLVSTSPSMHCVYLEKKKKVFFLLIWGKTLWWRLVMGRVAHVSQMNHMLLCLIKINATQTIHPRPALSLRNTLQPQHSGVIRRRGTPLISMSVHNFIIIHPIAVEIFQFGQKLTDSWLTGFHGWNHNHQQKEDSVSLSQRGFDRRLFPSSLAFTRDSTIIREAIRGRGALWTSRGSSKGQQTNRVWDMIQ